MTVKKWRPPAVAVQTANPSVGDLKSARNWSLLSPIGRYGLSVINLLVGLIGGA